MKPFAQLHAESALLYRYQAIARHLFCITHLGEAVEDSDDGLCVEANADGSVEGVRREHVLVHTLGPANRLGDGDQEVVRLAVHR